MNKSNGSRKSSTKIDYNKTIEVLSWWLQMPNATNKVIREKTGVSEGKAGGIRQMAIAVIAEDDLEISRIQQKNNFRDPEVIIAVKNFCKDNPSVRLWEAKQQRGRGRGTPKALTNNTEGQQKDRSAQLEMDEFSSDFGTMNMMPAADDGITDREAFYASLRYAETIGSSFYFKSKDYEVQIGWKST